MYFETGADSLRGILSPGAYYLRGGLSPGHIVLEAYCLGAGCLRGGSSPGQFVSGAHILRGILSFALDYLGALGHNVPPPESPTLLSRGRSSVGMSCVIALFQERDKSSF